VNPTAYWWCVISKALHKLSGYVWALVLPELSAFLAECDLILRRVAVTHCRQVGLRIRTDACHVLGLHVECSPVGDSLGLVPLTSCQGMRAKSSTCTYLSHCLCQFGLPNYASNTCVVHPGHTQWCLSEVPTHATSTPVLTEIQAGGINPMSPAGANAHECLPAGPAAAPPTSGGTQRLVARLAAGAAFLARSLASNSSSAPRVRARFTASALQQTCDGQCSACQGPPGIRSVHRQAGLPQDLAPMLLAVQKGARAGSHKQCTGFNWYVLTVPCASNPARPGTLERKVALRRAVRHSQQSLRGSAVAHCAHITARHQAGQCCTPKRSGPAATDGGARRGRRHPCLDTYTQLVRVTSARRATPGNGAPEEGLGISQRLVVIPLRGKGAPRAPAARVRDLPKRLEVWHGRQIWRVRVGVAPRAPGRVRLHDGGPRHSHTRMLCHIQTAPASNTPSPRIVRSCLCTHFQRPTLCASQPLHML
jgi:hypothetical protein